MKVAAGRERNLKGKGRIRFYFRFWWIEATRCGRADRR